MRLGLCLPESIARCDAPPESWDVVTVALCAEEAGFDSVWAFDALGRGFFLPEPLTCLVAAAVATQRLEVGAGVLQVGPRHPFDLAHRVLTAQQLCRGRLVLGVGAGSTRDDYVALGEDFDARFRLFAERLAIMQGLWNGEKVGEAVLSPEADSRGGPPVLIGARAGSRWIRRAAEEFDGWITSGAKTSWAQTQAAIGEFRAVGGGRALITHVPCRLGGEAPPDGPHDPVKLGGPTETVRASLERLAALGYDDVIIRMDRITPEGLARLRSLAP
jgi:alkanesulfonate monooxygenase SsuD/methylene tetrahydromethanopterin reductase-like flavin-dependent oxidoreductase (luciferase family)